MSDDRPLYESRALTVAEWSERSANMLSDGWEYRAAQNGVVYTRMHISGPRSTETEGWKNDV